MNNVDQYTYDDNYVPGEVRVLRLLNGEEFVVTHVGGGSDSPVFSNRKSIVYKDARQLVFHEQGVALVPVPTFYHESYKGNMRVSENLVISYMRASSLLEKEYQTAISKIAAATPSDVKAVQQSKLIV